MPSGAKKRKAARRRRRKEEVEMEQGVVHPPNSPTNPSPDSSHDGKESTSSSSSSSSSSDEEKQEERKHPAVNEMEKAAGVDDGVKVGEEEEEVAVPVSTEAGVVSVEFVQAEKSDVGVEESAAATVVPVVPTDAPVPADEEVVEAAEAAAEALETSLEIDSLSHETAVKPAPVLEETPVADLPRDTGELCHGTEITEPSQAPLAERRASWWNCCGLFDVLTRSKDIRA